MKIMTCYESKAERSEKVVGVSTFFFFWLLWWEGEYWSYWIQWMM